jgi:hypothetical protein
MAVVGYRHSGQWTNQQPTNCNRTSRHNAWH